MKKHLNKIKKRIINFSEVFHQRIFGHPMSDEMRNFLGNLSWSFFGGIVASVIMFLVNIMAGRWLGPEVYGKYNSLISLASVFSVFFVLSLDSASVRYLADKKYAKISKDIFTSVFFAVIFFGILISSLFILFSSYFSKNYFEDRNFLYWAIAIAFLIALKNLFNGFLRAFHKIKIQSFNRILDAFLVLIVFLYLVLVIENISHISYLQAIAVGGLFFIVSSVYFLRNFFSKFSFKILWKMFDEYNKFLIIGSFIGVFMTADKFIIGKLAGVRELGYFSAYYVASHLVVAELSGIFMNVFWPSVIKNAHSLKQIIKKIDTLFIFGSPLWILLIILNTSIFILFFGKEFPFRWDYVILFSINTFLGFLFSIWTSFLNINHIKKSVWLNGIFVLFSVGLLILSKNIVTYLVAQIFSQICLIYAIRRFLLKK